jgi:L-ascorbate metabolism protein UlaG (beta-lactamase superfamily)
VTDLPARGASTARIEYVGHATVLIELDGLTLVTDPVLRRRVAHLRRREPVDARRLDEADGVLISHVHYDHLHAASLRLLRRDVPVVAPVRSGGLLRRFDDVRELDAGEETHIGPLIVRATPALHRARRPLAPRSASLGFIVVGSRTVYFAGDTDLFDGMSGLADPLDLALLPVAGWGATTGHGHLDPERAVEAVVRLRPRIAVPIHWGTLAVVGRRPDAEAAEEFRRLAAERAPEVDVRVLPLGGSTQF